MVLLRKILHGVSILPNAPNFKQKSYTFHLEYAKKSRNWRFWKLSCYFTNFQVSKERKGSDAIENQSRLLKKFSFQVFEKEKANKTEVLKVVWQPYQDGDRRRRKVLPSLERFHVKFIFRI